MPVVLAQEFEAITKTLDTLMTVDLPRLIAMFGVLFILAIIVNSIVGWRRDASKNRSQQQIYHFFVNSLAQNAEHIETERQINRDAFQESLKAILEELHIGFNARGNDHAEQNLAIASLSDFCAEMARAIENVAKINAATDKTVLDGLEGICIGQEEMKTDMTDIKDANGDILKELQKLNETMEKMAQHQSQQASAMETMSADQKRQSTAIETMVVEVQSTMRSLLKTKPEDTDV